MAKKEKILETTLKLIAINGLNGSPMSKIAKESGVATGTIYHHFESKEAIINAIYLNKKKDFQQILAQHNSSEESIKSVFSNIWKGFYSYFVNNPLIFQFTQQISHSPIITEEVKAEGATYYQSIFDFYQDGIDQGVFIDMDLIIMGQLIFGNIISLVELQLNGTEITTHKLQQAITYSWRAILK